MSVVSFITDTDEKYAPPDSPMLRVELLGDEVSLQIVRKTSDTKPEAYEALEGVIVPFAALHGVLAGGIGDESYRERERRAQARAYEAPTPNGLCQVCGMRGFHVCPVETREEGTGESLAADLYARIKRKPGEGTASEAMKCHSQACGMVAFMLDIHPDAVAGAVAKQTQTEAKPESLNSKDSSLPSGPFFARREQ